MKNSTRHLPPRVATRRRRASWRETIVVGSSYNTVGRRSLPLSRSLFLSFSARRIASQAVEPFFATAAALLSRKAGSALTLAYVRRNVDWDVAITAAAAAGLTRCVEIEPLAARASAASRRLRRPLGGLCASLWGVVRQPLGGVCASPWGGVLQPLGGLCASPWGGVRQGVAGLCAWAWA